MEEKWNASSARKVVLALNGVALVLHCAWTSLGFWLWSDTSRRFITNLSVERPSYYSNNSGQLSGLNVAACSIQENNITILYETECSGNWDALLALSLVEGVTFLFHILYICEIVYPDTFNTFWWTRGIHPLRWLEYSITASTLSVATVIGIGIRDVYVFVLCWFALPAVQFCGYISETTIEDHYIKSRFLQKTGFSLVIRMNLCKSKKRVLTPPCFS